MLSELLGCKKGKLLSWILGNSRLKSYKFVPHTCTTVQSKPYLSSEAEDQFLFVQVLESQSLHSW